jgi:hypothetical protein
MTQRIVVVLAAALLMAIPAAAQELPEVLADAGEPLELDCSDAEGASYNLSGLGSTVNGVCMATDCPPDPPPPIPHPYAVDVTYHWTAAAEVGINDDTSPTPTVTFPVGVWVVTLDFTYTDPDPMGPGPITSKATVEVSVTDFNPPTIEAVSDPMVLWPPNHKLHEVDVDLVVLDSCDLEPEVLLTSVSSSEPENGIGDGNTAPDILEADVDTDDRNFLLRAERMGGGSGRVYTATYMATDASGNSSEPVVVEILVPHDQGDLKAAKAEAKAVEKMAKAEAKAMEKMAKAQAKADAKVEKQLAKELAKAAKQAAKAAKKNAKKGN